MSLAVVLLLLVTVVLTLTGVLKLLAVSAMRERAAHLGLGVGSFRAIGLLELAGVAGLWVGRVASEPLAVASTVALLALMVGAVVTHLRAGDRPTEAAPALVVATLLLALLVIGVGA